MGRKLRERWVGMKLSKGALTGGVLGALLLRWCVASHGYSGAGTPPMYGDYEAQRHWQEITLHTPRDQWYYNTTHNNLAYWGLDYPPLTAYHMFALGTIADYLEPESVRLFASRGYESDSHKMFMRFSVFICDIYFFLIAAMCLCIESERVKDRDCTNVFKRMDMSLTLFLLYPGIILVDHGHFQYNCVSLGLFMWATLFLIILETDVLAAVVFSLALNYKQMELYHALPFFFYMLRNCFKRLPNKSMLSSFLLNLNRTGLAVVATFIIVWMPFFTSWDSVLQILRRLFPLSRGVFEDKVSNVWCVLNVFVKLRPRFTNEQMAKICLYATAAASLPSCLNLFFKQNKSKFILSLINVSLAFFLFSFQVHEKTILLVAIPVAMHLPQDPFVCFWFLLVSNFSMLPLFIKDGLLIPFIATNLIYIGFYSLCVQLNYPSGNFFSMFSANIVYGTVAKSEVKNRILLRLLSGYFVVSLLGMVALTTASVLLKPPTHLPDLFPLLVSVYSCSHFIMFYLYFNYQQFIIPTQPKITVKKFN